MIGFEIAVTCLALNVYKEARGEELKGQQAVALVTLNRVASGKYPMDICKTVFQDKQFSWTATDSKGGVLLPHKRPDQKSVEWATAMRVAKQSLTLRDFTGGATHYHKIKVLPKWHKSMEFVGQWGNHRFYKERAK